MHYNYFRDYDPSTGRYVQSDPIGLAGGLNTYGYVYQNPLIKYDFYGLAEICNTGVPITFGFPHTFLCANGSCGGYRPSGNIWASEGAVDTDDQNYSGASCNNVPKGDCTEEELNKCVHTYITDHGNTGDIYNYSANNCGEWVTTVIQICRQQCVSK